MLISAPRSVLAVVDIQRRLAPAVQGNEAVAERAALLLRAARACAVPILVSEQYPTGLGSTLPALAALIEPGEVVSKIHFSGADEPEFLERLQRLARPQVVLCGMEAHVCVLQTALGLHQRGFDVFVAADATGSRNPANAGLALDRLRAEGVRVVTTEMVVFEWLHRADTPLFREMLPLIR